MTVSLLCGLALTPLVRDFAVRRGLLDHGTTSRKIHRRPVPRLGGVALVVAFFAALGVALRLSPGTLGGAAASESRLLAGLVVGGLAIAALGFLDDLRGVRARDKFLVQLGVATLAWAAGFRIDALSLPLVGFLELGAFGLPLTVLWIAGISNALNLVDGLDGLAAGVSLVVLVALFSVSLGHGDALLTLVTAALAGAVAAFLFFNVHPASIFMGDTGSMFIGFVLALVSIRASSTSSRAVELLVPVLALGYPIADTLLAMARRAARGVPLFSADRGHIHHRLLARGFSQRETALILCAVSAAFCGVASLVHESTGFRSLAAVVALGCGLVAAMRWLGLLDWTKLRELAAARQRNVERLQRVSELAAELQQASNSEALGASLAALGPALAVDHVSLKAWGRSWTFSPARNPNLHVVRYGLEPESAGEGVLEVGWTRSTAEADRDTEIAIEQLYPHVRAALRRLEPGRARGRAGPHAPAAASFAAIVRGKRALVTGAAGGAGREVCRQLAAQGVSELVMVDLDERGLELAARRLEAESPNVAVFPMLADVREYERLQRLCRHHRPHVVVHAAAHRDVAPGEDAPEDVVRNNVFGTLNVAVVAHESGVERLVVVSSDAAARPTSIVGATQRIAEMVVADLARRSTTRMAAVRVGGGAVGRALLQGLRGRGVSAPSAPLHDLSKQLHAVQEHALEGHRDALLLAIERLVPGYRSAAPRPAARAVTPIGALQVRRRAPTPLPGGAAPAIAVAPASATPVPAPALSIVGAPDEAESRRRTISGWLHLMTR